MVKRPVKIAVVGRPNVGKSSLTNALLGDERTLVSEISGTTRDAVDIPYERHGNSYVLIDTAGIRGRGKVDNVVEIFSVMRSESSIRRSDLCVLVLDATMGVTAQDKKIAGIIQESRRPCVVAVNKWDLIKERTDTKEALAKVLQEMRAELFFLDYAPLLLVSAKTKAEFTRLFKTIEKVRAKPGSVGWLAILDADGKTLITSDGPEGNIPYSDTPASKKQFEKMFRATARRLTAEEKQKLLNALGK